MRSRAAPLPKTPQTDPARVGRRFRSLPDEQQRWGPRALTRPDRPRAGNGASGSAIEFTRLRKRGVSGATPPGAVPLPSSCLCTASGLATRAALLLVVHSRS
jgi:hypothetical protein